MKYLFTTLAIGDKYADFAINNYQSNLDKLSGDFSILTEKEREADPRINIDVYKGIWENKRSRYNIFLNLKGNALQYGLDKDYDLIIYHDADWKIRKELDDSKIEKLFQYMQDNDIDLCGERPHRLGSSKHEKRCLFEDKVKRYNLLTHDKWDDAQVMNEQFIAVRNNNKLKFFCQRWEMFLHYSVYHNIDNYCEGLEMGVSALEAGMKLDLSGISGWGKNTIYQCFEFYDVSQNLHIRF